MEPDKDYNLTVGLRIREIRESLKMTRAEFSEKCNLSESFLAAVESGQKSITSKTLYKLCTTYNISADYIIRGHGQDYETDMIVERLKQLDRNSRASANRILQEYYEAISKAKAKNDN